MDESIYFEGMSGVFSKYRVFGEGSCVRELRDYEMLSLFLVCLWIGLRYRGIWRE